MGKAEGPSSGDGGNAKNRRICAWAVAVALVAVALALAIAAGSGNTPEIPDSATGNKSCECLPKSRVILLSLLSRTLSFSDPSEHLCHEKKVMYKLISGLHSSISVHIASDYLLDAFTNSWGQNLELLYDRVWKHPDRVRNLYFVYLFVLRAVTKVTHSNPASIVELNSPFAER
ncbi:hypothetical protein BHM03_00032627 [Ensete ventricosum]|nr:hypothetical protein BHM03_00032627 [Ensete ventricosum]